MAFSSRRFRVFLVALACTAVLAWLCLAPVGVVGLALGRPVLLVVLASVFSRFRGPILGCQPVMAPTLSRNGALVVLVEVLLGPACFASAVLLTAVSFLMVRVVWSFGSCILVKVLPRIALCRFWRRFFPGVLCVRFGPPLCCPCDSKCAVWLGRVLVRFSQDSSWHFLVEVLPKIYGWRRDPRDPWRGSERSGHYTADVNAPDMHGTDMPFHACPSDDALKEAATSVDSIGQDTISRSIKSNALMPMCNLRMGIVTTEAMASRGRLANVQVHEEEQRENANAGQ
ncbi:hypothetical protein Taro_048397 [Colocasia esculenta]|uniref:Uncharacterized protein n=1 Tax=Colocasia esculenta TaxID=4460 RepID=A0A843WY26_COLES|nr:hypothetical protein [Colocasia esculenta]